MSGGGAHYRTIMVSIVALCAAAPAPCSAQSAPRDRYVAPWIALPHAEPVTLTASGKNWTGIVALRAKSLLVLNDPVNLMSYVVLVFKKVIGFDEPTARKHMLEVHEGGRSVVWVGLRERAEAYVFALQQWHLTAVLESDEAH